MSAPMKDTGDKIALAVKTATGFLLKGNEISDDTLIHSFFDNVKLNVHTIDCIESSGLQTFIEEVANTWKTLDSSVVVLGLQVTAWLADNDVYYRHFKSSVHQVFSVLCRDVQTTGLSDTSVLTALYESLTTLARQQEGLQWIVCDKQIAGVTMAGVRQLTISSSIFLEKAVISYLSAVTQEVDKLDKETAVSGCVLISSEILQTTLQNIRKHYTKKHLGPFVPGSVQLLETLCQQSDVTGKCLLTQHADFCGYLVDLIDVLGPRDCDAVMSIIDSLLHVGVNEDKFTVNVELMCDLIKRIEKQLTDLASNGNIVTAQKLAACCLKTQGSEKLKEICVGILTEPVHWILDKCLKNSLFSEHILQAALSTKSRCTDIVCRSLNGHIGEVIITDVLRKTTVFCGHEDKPNSEAVSYLYKNRTVQRRCLEILTLVKPPKNADSSSLLPKVQIIVELFRESDSDTVIYSLCSQLLLECVPLLFTNEETVSLAVTLAQVIQYHLSALQWELRDTTLELLGNIMAGYNNHTSVVQWLVDHRLHVQVWKCVMDGESYVRASAISAVYHLYQCPRLLSALVDSGVVSGENDIIQTVADIIDKDTEAFARRSAITFLFKFFKVKVSLDDSSDIIPDVVMATIVTATKDFDWEVKLVALDFVSFILQQEVSKHFKSGTFSHEIPEYARSLCNSKSMKENELQVDIDVLMDRPYNKQLVNVLFDTLDDYDEKVCEKAVSVLSELQAELSALAESNIATAGQKRYRYTSSVHTEQLLPKRTGEHFNVVEEGETKKRKLDDMCATGTSEMMKCSEPGEETSVKHNTKTENSEKSFRDVRHSGISNGVSCGVNGGEDGITEKYENVLNRILDFDLSVYKLRLEKGHDSSVTLLSLVEDIVTSENKTDDENAVDCY